MKITVLILFSLFLGSGSNPKELPQWTTKSKWYKREKPIHPHN